MNIESYLKQVEGLMQLAKVAGNGRYILTIQESKLVMLKAEAYEGCMPLLWMFNHHSFTWGLTSENWNCLADRIAKQVKKGALK